VKTAAELIAPLYETLVKKILKSNYLQADETRTQVLDRDKKEKTHRGFLWVYRSVEQGLVLFDYNKSRGKEGPRKMLKDFSGFLQSDGYSVYDEFGLKDKITLVGCMAHARRYFEKSLDSNKTEASYFISRLQEVYAIERTIREDQLKAEQITAIRKEKALPVLNELGLWLKENIIHYPPQTPIGKAMAYSLSRWDKLTQYIHNPLLEIDNNLVENAIRPTVLGRKNYLFSGSHQGAERSAMIYSFIGSCKINNINPSEWLADVLVKVKDTKASQLYTLLPNCWKKS
jgi:transposase